MSLFGRDSDSGEYSGYRLATHDVSFLLTEDHRHAGLSLIEDPNCNELQLYHTRSATWQKRIASFRLDNVNQGSIHEAADMYLMALSEHELVAVG